MEESLTLKIFEACRDGDSKTVFHCLSTGGQDPDEKNEKGQTCLHISCSTGRAYIASLLIDHGADVMAVDNYGNTPLHCCGHKEIILLLVNKLAKLDARY